jgi:hypothetical protein
VQTRSSSAGFEGTEGAVRSAAERAEIPFERILESAHSPWHHAAPIVVEEKR